MQTVLTYIIIICAVAYAAYRTYDALRHGGDPCRGCKLADRCQSRTKKRSERLSPRKHGTRR